MDFKLERVEGVVDSIESDVEYILGVIEELKGEGADFMINSSSDFANYYKRYLDKFNDAVKLVRLSNDIKYELYPLQDPRLLIAQIVDYRLLDGDEKKEFLANFNMKQIKPNQMVKAHFYDKAQVQGEPLPTTSKFYTE